MPEPHIPFSGFGEDIHGECDLCATNDPTEPHESIVRGQPTNPNTKQHIIYTQPNNQPINSTGNSDIKNALSILSYAICSDKQHTADSELIKCWSIICQKLSNINNNTNCVDNINNTNNNVIQPPSHPTIDTKLLSNDTDDIFRPPSTDNKQLINTNHSRGISGGSNATDEQYYDVTLQTYTHKNKHLYRIDTSQLKRKQIESYQPHKLIQYNDMNTYKKYWFIFRREFCNVTSLGHRIWATIIVLSVIYFSVTTPFEMAFYTRLADHTWLTSVGLTLDILFILDVIKSLFTGYDTDDFLAFNFKTNLIRYSVDGTLFFDLLSVTYLPFEFLEVTAFSAAYELVRLARWYKVSLYLRHISKNNVASTGYEQTRVLRYLSLFLVIIHLFSCIYIYIGYVQINQGVQCTWMSANSNGCAGNGYYNAGYVPLYINAFFYGAASISSDGYGTSMPITPVEQAYTAAFQLFGQLYFAFFVATLVASLGSNDAVHATFRAKLRSVNALLEYKSVPSALRERVVDYYQYSFHQRKTYPFFQQDVFNDLSHSLRRTITTQINSPLCAQVYLLQGADQHFMRRLMTCMTQLILVPGDYLVVQGDINTSMLFITKGVCEVKVDGQVIGNLVEGDHCMYCICLYQTMYTLSCCVVYYCTSIRTMLLSCIYC